MVKMSKGIVEYKGYLFWHHVKVVKENVWKFLENKFPEYIVYPEMFRADFFILNENLPVEVQSTILVKYKSGVKGIDHSRFESVIQKQIQENVELFGKCWFFFDFAYLQFLKSDITTSCKINFDWLYQFMKTDKVKVFTISYDGNIAQVSRKEFSFLLKTSLTCKLNRDSDRNILDINKFSIMELLLKNYNFTTEEINEMYGEFNKFPEDKVFLKWAQSKKSSSRTQLFGRILSAIGNLQLINNLLDIDGAEVKLTRSNKTYFVTLGLFDVKGNAKGAKTFFVDKFKVADYFPGYLRNKETWDFLRLKYVTFRTLNQIVTNAITINEIENSPLEMNREKREIIRNTLLNVNGFTKEEIQYYRQEYKKDESAGSKFENWLIKSCRTERQKLLQKILIHSTRIGYIDDFFNRNDSVSTSKSLKFTLVVLGIIDTTKGGKYAKCKFVDRYEFGSLFSGYANNKSFWDSIKNKNLNHNDFWDLICDRNKGMLKPSE